MKDLETDLSNNPLELPTWFLIQSSDVFDFLSESLELFSKILLKNLVEKIDPGTHFAFLEKVLTDVQLNILLVHRKCVLT